MMRSDIGPQNGSLYAGRFVLPVLPLSMMFAGYGLTILERSNESQKDDSDEIKESPLVPAMKTSSRNYGGNMGHNAPKKFWWIILGLLATNVPTALYTSVIHQVLTFSGGFRFVQKFCRWRTRNCEKLS